MQEEALGLGHAIFLSRHTIGTDPLLIILGDTIFDVDLRPVLRGGSSALGVKAVDDPRGWNLKSALSWCEQNRTSVRSKQDTRVRAKEEFGVGRAFGCCLCRAGIGML